MDIVSLLMGASIASVAWIGFLPLGEAETARATRSGHCRRQRPR